MSFRRSHAILGAAIAGGAVAGLGYGRFRRDIRAAELRVDAGGTLALTRVGPIEYAQVGQGKDLLIVHGAGGGYDQGLLFARPLAESGLRITAMSRFGYLRTPLPADASPQAQADAHASLLDTLGIREPIVIGASAGAPSAMQFAIRHPQRCSALVLVVPLTWKPKAVPDSAPVPSQRGKLLLQWLVGSDLAFWLAAHAARNALIRSVLGTPPSLLMEASPSEQARVAEVPHGIAPLARRAAGLRNDARTADSLVRYELEAIRAPTLVMSVRDDLYGTFAGAQYTAQCIPGARFIGYEHGGHLWVGHHDEALREIASFAARA